jgi:Dipeptidyl aminopeptidases/acylaminoacyl-peptidases
VNTPTRPFTIDDLARIRTLSDPQISPDGSRIAVVVKTMDVEKNRYETHLHLVHTDTGEMRQITFSSGTGSGESSPRWSPDGKWLAFVSGRESKGKKPQVYRLPADGAGEAERLTDLPQGALADIAWSPDGTRIAFRFRPQDEVWREEAAEERKKKELSTPPREITRLHFREEGAGFLPQAARWRLHVLDLATREVTQMATGGGEDADDGAFCWSPDGEEVVVVRNVAADPDLAPNEEALFVVPAGGLSEGEGPRRLNTALGPKNDPAWSPDGKYVAYLGHDDPVEVWGVRNQHLWITAADGTGEARDLTTEFDVTLGSTAIGDVAGGGQAGPVWTADSASLLVLASDRGAVDVYRVPVPAEDAEAEAPAPSRLTEGVHAVLGLSADTRAENLALLVATPADAGDLYVLPLGAPFFRRLTRANEALLSEVDFAAPVAFEADAPDGQKVPGFAVLPPDFAQNPGPRPTLLYIHGGPHTMYAHTLFHEYQALAAAGYVVVYPNPRGSKGYGEAWTAAIRGEWGAPAQTDCEACLDYAIAQGWSDPDRLGVAGGSYGGYLTAWIVGHSDRFKAAVAERGVYNLHSMAGTCDFVWRDDRSYFDATATDAPAEYLRNSPLTYAGNVTTPLLLIHSEGDLRCPIEQADQYFSALKRLGKCDVTYLRYGPEANHNLSRTGPPDIRLDRQRRIHAFFNKHLKGSAE